MVKWNARPGKKINVPSFGNLLGFLYVSDMTGSRFFGKGGGVCRAVFTRIFARPEVRMIYDVSAAFCNEKGTLKSICPLITGDALLYSMFRETGNPMQCPFKPPYTFTYNRGHGDCKNPVSTVEACTQDSRLLIRYQACPDVEGSESARELTRQCPRAG